MKILHVVPSYLPATRYGGPIYSVHALCRALARRGHDVHVFTTNVDGAGVSDVPLGRAVDVDGVRVSYFPTAFGRRLYRSPAMGRALAGSLRHYDILHLHSVFLWPTTAAAQAARRQGVPYVLAPRGMLVSDLVRQRSRLAKAIWIEAFERRNVARAAAVHVTAALEAEELSGLGLETRRIAIIPNGLDPPGRPAPSARPPCAGIPRPRVLCLGRLNWKKGIDRLIRAMAYVEHAHLVIAGDDEGGYRAELEKLARGIGVGARTHFFGPVHGSAKWDLLAQSDVFVLASHSENFGNAVLEAMGAAVPVVVTPQVGLAGTIAEARAGLVVEGDPIAIGRAVASLLDNPDLRRQMGAAGRHAALERFSWPAIAQRAEELYEALAQERRRPTNVGSTAGSRAQSPIEDNGAAPA